MAADVGVSSREARDRFAQDPQHRGERAGLARRRTTAIAVVVGILLALTALSLAIGSAPIGLDVVWQAITAYDPSDPAQIAVREKRLPRTVIGVVVGAALGIAGVLCQGMTRNPLADPGILGISQGAALAVVIGITVFSATSPAGYLWFALAGAAAAGALVWAIAAGGREGATPAKLALSGAAIAAAMGSLVAGVLIANRGALDTMRFWQVGALAGRGFDVLLPVLPVLIVGTVGALACARRLDFLALGDDVASGLGIRVGRTRLLTAASIVALAGAATAVAGPIAFVGLIVPHVVRTFSGPDHRWLLWLSAPIAAALLLAADIIARVVARPAELQVGIVVAMIGAPFFIAIVRRSRAAGL